MTEPAPSVDPLALANQRLELVQAENARLKQEIAALEKPSTWSGVKEKLGKVANGVLAAFTSSAAVKQEKNLAALAITRLVLMAGAGAATSDGVYKLLQALGWVS